MKRNVDLSESRMFTTPKEPTGLIRLFLDAMKVTKPWDFENNFQNNTGESEELGLFNFCNYAYDTDEICDCCGQSVGKKPWAKNRCNCYSMSYTPKIPWKF